MTVARLGDVATFVRGITFKPNDLVPLDAADSVACMRTKNVQAELDLSDVWAVPKRFVPRDDQLLRAGDVLVSSANSLNLVGKCSWVPELPWVSSFGGFVSVLRSASPKLDARYLYRWFSSTRVQTTLRSFGRQTTNISNLDIQRCLDLELRFPPLPEQRRIAEVLDRAETLRAQRRQALAQLDALAESIFLDMFGDVKTGPRFPVGTIRPFVEASSGKSSKPVLAATKTPIPIYGGNGVNGWATAVLYESPVLVFGRVGQQCGNAFMTEGPSWVTDNAIVVQVVDAEKLDATYLLHAFRMSDFSQRVKHLDLPFINQAMIVDTPIVIPPLLAQQRFSACVRSVGALMSVHRAALAELDALFASLQHRAFRGEL